MTMLWPPRPAKPIPLSPLPRLISLRVVNAHDRGLPGAEVSLTPDDGPSDWQVADRNGRVTFAVIATGTARVTAEADGYAGVTYGVHMPAMSTDGPVDGWPGLITLTRLATGPLTVQGMFFLAASGHRFFVRGSSDFRLAELILSGREAQARAVVEDRKSCGANLLRILSMKASNTRAAWSLDPRHPGHRDLRRRTFDLLGDLGLLGQWCVLADTRAWMPDPAEQVDYFLSNCEDARPYPHIWLECLNEANHPTQQVPDPTIFQKPEGILSSHGSRLTDEQPQTPFWDFATYSARRDPAPPSPKPATNYCALVFRDGDPWPLPCPFVPQEGVKPAQYGYDPRYARLMGQCARIGAGATFHHDAWDEGRLFTGEERACAVAFYEALQP